MVIIKNGVGLYSATHVKNYFQIVCFLHIASRKAMITVMLLTYNIHTY